MHIFKAPDLLKRLQKACYVSPNHQSHHSLFRRYPTIPIFFTRMVAHLLALLILSCGKFHSPVPKNCRLTQILAVVLCVSAWLFKKFVVTRLSIRNSGQVSDTV